MALLGSRNQALSLGSPNPNSIPNCQESSPVAPVLIIILIGWQELSPVARVGVVGVVCGFQMALGFASMAKMVYFVVGGHVTGRQFHEAWLRDYDQVSVITQAITPGSLSSPRSPVSPTGEGSSEHGSGQSMFDFPVEIEVNCTETILSLVLDSETQVISKRYQTLDLEVGATLQAHLYPPGLSDPREPDTPPRGDNAIIEATVAIFMSPDAASADMPEGSESPTADSVYGSLPRHQNDAHLIFQRRRDGFHSACTHPTLPTCYELRRFSGES